MTDEPKLVTCRAVSARRAAAVPMPVPDTTETDAEMAKRYRETYGAASWTPDQVERAVAAAPIVHRASPSPAAPVPDERLGDEQRVSDPYKLTDRLAQIAARAEAATRGPWEAFRQRTRAGHDTMGGGLVDRDESVCEDRHMQSGNAEFMAHDRHARPGAAAHPDFDPV